MIISNDLFSNLHYYQKLCLITLQFANMLFNNFTLLVNNRFVIWFAKLNTTFFSLTLWLIPFSPCWLSPPQELSLPPPWPVLRSSCYLFLLFQRFVNNGYIFLWTILLASALLLLCIHSKCLWTTLWSLLQIFTPLLNPAPLLTEIMLLCYPAALSFTCFHFAGEILW